MKALYIDVQNSICRFSDNGREIDWKLFFDYVTKRYAIDRIYFAVGYVHSLQSYNTLIQFFQKNNVRGMLFLPDGKTASRAITCLEPKARQLQLDKPIFEKQKASIMETS